MNDFGLKSIPPGIGESAPYLKAFMTYGGNIELIDRNTFKAMKNLEKLWLWNQKIAFLPEDVFWDLKNIRDLKFQSNLIEKLPENLFSKSLNLKIVNFSGNKLVYLDENLFENNLQLEIIQFINNRLKRISVDFTQLTKVKEINFITNVCINHWFGTGNRGGNKGVNTVQKLQMFINRNCAG